MSGPVLVMSPEVEVEVEATVARDGTEAATSYQVGALLRRESQVPVRVAGAHTI